MMIEDLARDVVFAAFAIAALAFALLLAAASLYMILGLLVDVAGIIRGKANKDCKRIKGENDG